MIGEGQGDRRDRHLQGHVLGLDTGQHLVEIEAAVQANRRTGFDRREEIEQPEDVRRRGRDLEPIVGAQTQRLDPVSRCVAQRTMGVAHRLGHAGRARTEHQHRVGVGVGVGVGVDVYVGVGVSCGVSALGRNGFCFALAGPELAIGDVHDPLGAQLRAEHAYRVVVSDAQHRCRQRDRIGDLGAFPCRADEDRNAPGANDAEHRGEELDAVGHHDRDPGTRLDSTSAQRRCDVAHGGVERLEGPGVLPRANGDAVAEPLRSPSQTAIQY